MEGWAFFDHREVPTGGGEFTLSFAGDDSFSFGQNSFLFLGEKNENPSQEISTQLGAGTTLCIQGLPLLRRVVFILVIYAIS